MRYLLAGIVRAYQFLLSPVWHALMGPQAGCRFTPNCSEYARQALLKHGAWKGTVLALKRVARCHPGNPGGYDPVP
jgi:uncharacterized protein